MGGYKYAACRTLGHSWLPSTVEVIRQGRKRTYVQNLYCACGTEKSVHIEETGYVSKSSYEYPDGYALKGRNSSERNARMRRMYISELS